MPENNNGYNPEGIEDINPENVPVNEPNTADSLVHMGQNAANAGKSIAQGVDKFRNRNNPNNDLAKGVDSPKKDNLGNNLDKEKETGDNSNNSPEAKKDNKVDNKEGNNSKPESNNHNTNDNSNNQSSTTIPGQTKNSPKENKDNNLMTGQKKNSDKNDQKKDKPKSPEKKPQGKNPAKEAGNKLNKKGAGAGIASRFNPLNRLRNNSEKKDDSEGKKITGAGAATAAASSLGDKLKMAAINANSLPIKIGIIAGVLLLIFVLFLVLFISMGTSDEDATECNQSEYSLSTGTPADVADFMCAMKEPVKNSKSKISSLYGWRLEFANTFHNGIDIADSTGTSIYAVADGEVILTGWQGGYGNAIQIKHGDKITTWYAHLSSIGVSNGQKVKQGDKIGNMGNTGHSFGSHLHFEVRAGKDGDTSVSPNQYFGYSDKGYEKCLNKNKSSYGCSIDVSRSARKIKDDEQSQTCNITSSYFNDGDNSECCESSEGSSASDSLRKFINHFEGSGGYCNSSKTEYKAYQNRGDRVTIGYGVTSDYLPNLRSAGQCMSVSEVDAAQNKAIESKRKNVVDKNFSGVSLQQQQSDAMTSMAYNGCAGYFKNIAKASANDDLQGVWNAMKGCTNNGMAGLKSRRKAEFALYVTGDYSTDTIKKYQKSYSASEYDDYDSEGVIAKKASGSSSSCSSSLATGDRKAVVEIANREYKEWNSSSDHCGMKAKYLKSCGQRGCSLAWCAGFTYYVLKEAGIADKIKLKPSCIATLMDRSENTTFHKGGSSYVPQPGDVITFDWSGGRSYRSHVGLVEKVEGKTVHTIEGNSSHNIRKKTYPIDSKYIHGYVAY